VPEARISKRIEGLFQTTINAWLAERNTKPKPFKWTAKADTILQKNARARQVLTQVAAMGTN
jgi:hypothetical protein